MPKKEIVDSIKREIEKVDKAIFDVDEERKTLLEERSVYVRTINWLTGENLPEVSLHAYERALARKGASDAGENGNGNGKKRYEPRVGKEPNPNTKKGMVLEYLRKAGPMTAAQLGDALGYDKNALSAQLTLLGHQKLVERQVGIGNAYVYRAATVRAIEDELHGNDTGLFANVVEEPEPALV